MPKAKSPSKGRWRALFLLSGITSAIVLLLTEATPDVPVMALPYVLIAIGIGTSAYWVYYRRDSGGASSSLGHVGVLAAFLGIVMLLHTYSILSDLLFLTAAFGLLIVGLIAVLQSRRQLSPTIDLALQQGPVHWALEPTNPDLLDWKPLLMVFRNFERLRMNITQQNVSNQLSEAFRHLAYPSEDPPEVVGILRVLDRACSRAGVRYQLERGSSSLQGYLITAFEPYRIRLEFEKATLSMLIVWSEFQWIFRKARKEPRSAREKLRLLKQEIMEGSREWVSNGNR